LIRDGHAAIGIAVLQELGMVHQYCQPDQRADAMIEAWLALREQDDHNDVRMLATENSVVERLNLAARAALIHRGEISRRGRTYVSGDDTRDIRLAIGDRIRLGRNDGHLSQPDGSRVQVRNGMEGTITATTRHHVTVQLDDGEDLPHVTLPAAYVGECVDYAYALTANKAQGMTVDHVLFAPSAASSQETAYTALSRGRYANHIFAVIDSGWEEALGASKAHTFASDQQPILNDKGCLAEMGCQPAAERGGDVRARLLAAHQANRAAAATVTPGQDLERDQARQQREQSERQSREDRRRERDRQGRHDDGLHIGM
jgi:hypothetical protein